MRRKAEVVAAVNGGLLSVDEVCERYGLSVEEFAGWQRAIDRSGMPGLRVTRIQHYKIALRAPAEDIESASKPVGTLAEPNRIRNKRTSARLVHPERR